MLKPIVILESPYKKTEINSIETHMEYLTRALKDSLFNGEAPFASHQLYTTALDDNEPSDRRLGMEAGYAFYPHASYMVVYTDYGISSGMKAGIKRATNLKLDIRFREIGRNPQKRKVSPLSGSTF